MNRFTTFAFLVCASFITLQLLLAYQSRLVIERLDALEAVACPACTCEVAAEEEAAPMREPWPEAI